MTTEPHVPAKAILICNLVRAFSDHMRGRFVRSQRVEAVELLFDTLTREGDGPARIYLSLVFEEAPHLIGKDDAPEERLVKRVFDSNPQSAIDRVHDEDELLRILRGAIVIPDREWVLDDE